MASSAKGKSKKVESGKESLKDKRRSASKKGQRNTESQSPPLNVITPLYDTEYGNLTGEGPQDHIHRC